MKRMLLSLGTFLLLAGLILGVNQIASSNDSSDCSYSRDLEVTGCDVVFDYIAFPFEMSSALFISLDMLQSDADDVYVTEGGTDREVFACDLSSNDSLYRTFTEDLGVGDREVLTVWFGDPSGTRNQWWVGSYGDMNYCEDPTDFMMEGTWNFYVRSDIKCYDPPSSSNRHLVAGAPGCYELAVTSGSVTWTVWDDNSYTGIRTVEACPTSYVDSTGCSTCNHYEYLCDNSTSSYVTMDGDAYSFDTSYGVGGEVPLLFSLGEEITGVSVQWQAKREDLSSAGTFTLYLEDKDENVSYFSPVSATGGIVWYSTGTKTTNPSGGVWDVTDFLDLKVGMEFDSAGWHDGAIIYELYVAARVRSGNNNTSLEVPLTVASPQDVIGYYLYNGGAPILMLVDFTNGLSGTTSYSYSDIRNFPSHFRAGEFNGALDGAVVRVEN